MATRNSALINRLPRRRDAKTDNNAIFEAGLDGLKEQLTSMGGKAELAVDLAVQCYLTREVRLCSELPSIETQLSECERSIDEIAIQLHSHQALNNSNLRPLAGYMKISTNLKHIGETALQIGDRILSDYQPRILFPENIQAIGTAASEMIHRAVNALCEADGDTADAVLDMSDIVKRISDETWVYLVAEIRESPQSSPSALNALLVTRNLEQVAGYAANMARDILFWVCGADPELRVVPQIGGRSLAHVSFLTGDVARRRTLGVRAGHMGPAGAENHVNV
jgi:phosphate transport system protein